MARMRRAWPFLVLVLLPLLPLYRAVFLGEAIGPHQEIRQMAPWNGPAPVRPWDVLQADGVLQSYVWRDLVLESWGQGVLPAWNPYVLLGTPLLANSQSGALYPPHILLGLLRVPNAAAGTLLAYLHLLVAAWGAYALARGLGASESGGLLAGITFGLSPFLLAWTALASVPATTCWIPVALACVVHSFADERRFGSILGLALSVALMLLAGHLQFAAYGLLAIGLFAFGFAFRERRFEFLPIVRVTTAVLVGVMLAAPQLIPVFIFSRESHRQTPATPEGYAAYAASAIQPFELATLAAPFALGNPREPGPIQATSTQRLSTYWPPLVKPGANYAESALTVGAVAFVLLAFAPWRRRGVLPLAIVSLVALGLAFGTPLAAALYFGVPGWSATGSPGRAVILFVLAVAILAGLALPNTPTGRTDLKRPATLLALAVLLPFVTGRLLAPASPEGVAEALDPNRALSLLVAAGIAAGLGGLALVVLSQRPQWLPALAALAVLPSLALVSTGPPLPPPAEPTSNRVAVTNDAWDLLIAAPALAPPNTLALGRVRDAGGYDSLLSRDTKRLLDDANGGDSAPPANGNIQFVKSGADPEKLRALGIAERWTRAPDGTVAVETIGGKRIEGGEITQENRQGMTIQATGPLTVRERNLAGWTANVDGQPAPIPPGDWIVLPLEGPHTVRLTYTPPGFTTGISLAAGAGAILIVIGFWSRRNFQLTLKSSPDVE